MINTSTFKIVIENPKGSYKSFQMEDDPDWRTYPLKGVTYPVDYGYIEGYKGEDGASPDVFVGTGKTNGFIQVWRLDVPQETKFFIGLTSGELKHVLSVFNLVLVDYKILDDELFTAEIEKFRKKSG